MRKLKIVFQIIIAFIVALAAYSFFLSAKRRKRACGGKK